MNEKIEGLKAFLQGNAEQLQQVAMKLKAQAETGIDQASKAINTFADRDDTKAAVKWAKEAGQTAADYTVDAGKRAANSEMGKDIAAGAVGGAIVGIPLPIIGPIGGAVIGAGVAVAKNMNSGGSNKPTTFDAKAAQSAPDIDIHKRLTELNDLREKGILSQDEFDKQKRKVLGN